MKTKKTIGVAVAMMAILSVAPPVSATSLTLEEAVRIGVEEGIEVLKSAQDMDKSEAGQLVARSALFPSLSLGGKYKRQDERHALAEEANSYGISITATQPVYTGGKATALLKQSQAYETSVLEAVTDAKETVAYSVIRQFYDVLHLRENVAAARDSMAFAESHLKEVVKKEVLGVANRFEVTRAEQQLSGYRTQLITAVNDLESAKIALLTTLRMDPESDVKIEGSLDFVPYIGDREGSLERAMANRPDLKASLSSLEIQRQEIQVAASGLRPKVDLKASYTWDDPKESDGTDDDDWEIALEVDVPILDRNVTKAQIMREKANLRQRELDLQKLREAIRSEVSQAWLNLETAKQAVESTSKDLELASESLRLAQVGYREGVSTQIDVLDAQASYTKARKEHAMAVSAYSVQVAALERTEGELVSHVLKENGGEDR
jgi:outer membrane protein TolC